jgi:hypothetical protein
LQQTEQVLGVGQVRLGGRLLSIPSSAMVSGAAQCESPDLVAERI